VFYSRGCCKPEKIQVNYVSSFQTLSLLSQEKLVADIALTGNEVVHFPQKLMVILLLGVQIPHKTAEIAVK